MPQARQLRPPLVNVFVTVLVLVLMWSTWLAARNGLSDLYARPAIDYLEEKRFEAYKLSEAEWRAIETSVTQADNLMPGNPQYQEALGLLHQLKLSLFVTELNNREVNAHAIAARDYFYRAVENRPTWPYYWGNLALEHYRRGNYVTAEYSLALANAARFGPWQNDTQRLLTDLGTATWEFLSPSAQHELVLNIERGLHRQPENIVRAVQAYDGWLKICAASSGLPNVALSHLHALCAQERFAE